MINPGYNKIAGFLTFRPTKEKNDTLVIILFNLKFKKSFIIKLIHKFTEFILIRSPHPFYFCNI